MKTSSKACLALAAVLFAAGGPGAVAQDKKLPNIVILATGGTIAGAAATGTQSGYTSGAVTIDAMLTGRARHQGAGQRQGGADLQRRLPGHELRHHDEARQPHQRAGGQRRRGRLRDHPRHRHHGGDGLLPEPGGEDRQAGGAGGLHAPLHRGQRRRAPEPLQRRGRGRRSQGPRARRAPGHERLDPRRPLPDQDQHHRGADLHVADPRRGGDGRLRQERLLQHPALEAHHGQRVQRQGRHQAAAGGHHLRRRRHVARPHRLRGRQRGQGHRDRRRRQRQHEQGVAGRRRPRGQERRGGRAQQPRGDRATSAATWRSTTTS